MQAQDQGDTRHGPARVSLGLAKVHFSLPGHTATSVFADDMVTGRPGVSQVTLKQNGLDRLRGQPVQASGAGEESRTPDLRITNALLYQLSYTGENPHYKCAPQLEASRW